MRALLFYRVMAYVTGVVLATSCVFALSFWPWALGERHAGWLWTAHGYLYIVYVVAAFVLGYLRRWRLVRIVLVMLAGTVPLMSFVAERYVVRHEADPAGPHATEGGVAASKDA